MDFERPAELTAYLEELDRFTAAEIAPLQAEDDNQRFFDYGSDATFMGAAEIQMRKVAAFLFGYLGPKRKRFQGAAS